MHCEPPTQDNKQLDEHLQQPATTSGRRPRATQRAQHREIVAHHDGIVVHRGVHRTVPPASKMAAVLLHLLSAGAPSVVVIGGGWAGFGTAWGLAQRGVPVTLLEASSKAVGGLAAGWSGPDGRPVELGIHGFWRSYKNCFRLVEQLGLPLDSVFTPYASPALYTASGLSVVAPVFGDLPRLPTPLGTALYPSFSRLSPADRASAAALLFEFVDFDGSPEARDRATHGALPHRAPSPRCPADLVHLVWHRRGNATTGSARVRRARARLTRALRRVPRAYDARAADGAG